MKRRRLDVLRAERDRVARDLADGRLHLVVGGRRLAGTRHHLADAGMTVETWAAERDRAVFWFGCQGNTGKVGGNHVFRLAVDDPTRPGAAFLTVRLPDATARRFGIPRLLRLTHPVPVVHRRHELLDRVATRAAVTYDLTLDTDRRGRERVFLAACWTRPKNETLDHLPSLVDLRHADAGGVVGVDVNADHLTAARVDPAGNPIGAGITIPLALRGLPSSLRRARLQEAVTVLLRYATTPVPGHGPAAAVAVEDLGFDTMRDGRRWTHRPSRGRVGRRYRGMLGALPTTQLRDTLVAMADNAGLAVIVADPAYTSQVGGTAWAQVRRGGWTTTTRPDGTTVLVPVRSNRSSVTRHEGAAVAVARRALALGLNAGPRTRGVRGEPNPTGHGTTRQGRAVEDGSSQTPGSGGEGIRRTRTAAALHARTRRGSTASTRHPRDLMVTGVSTGGAVGDRPAVPAGAAPVTGPTRSRGKPGIGSPAPAPPHDG